MNYENSKMLQPFKHDNTIPWGISVVLNNFAKIAFALHRDSGVFQFYVYRDNVYR